MFQCRTRLCWWCKLITPCYIGTHVGFNAARGFVCGARARSRRRPQWPIVSMPLAALFVVQEDSSRYLSWLQGFNAARGFVCGASGVCQRHSLVVWSFNAARGFVCGARKLPKPRRWPTSVSMPLAALFVVQEVVFLVVRDRDLFQCRSRLCLWCKLRHASVREKRSMFQCRSRLCLWCKNLTATSLVTSDTFQCRSRLCLWCKNIIV